MLPVEERRTWIKSRRQKRKQARMARTRRQVLRMGLLCTILAIGCLGFTYLPWSLNDIEEQIKVRGNDFTSTPQIRTALGAAMYKPVYGLDPQDLEKKVEKLETVKNAFVRRYAFPRPHVVVEVLEEQPWASLGFDPNLPPHAVIAESGRIIPVSKFPRVIQPALKIYATTSLRMTGNDVKQWATWVTYIEKQTGKPVDYVDMRQPFDVRVQSGTLAVKLGIPDATLTTRLGRLTSILPTLKQYEDSLEYVDLALDNNIPIKVAKKSDKDKKTTASAQTPKAEPQVVKPESQPVQTSATPDTVPL